MKKLTALLMVFVLCVSLLPAAFAQGTVAIEEETEEGTDELEDEAVELAGYTLDDAKYVIRACDLEGKTSKIKQIAMQFWIPNELNRMDVPQKAIDNGYLAFYEGPGFVVTVALQNYGLSMDDYISAVEENRVENLHLEDVNEREFVIYDELQKDGSFCRVAATSWDEETMLEFVFQAQDDNVDFLTSVVIATIRPAQ